MNNFCPRCGSAARVLLNLVGCLTPGCRNYEPKWVIEWQSRNARHYTHHDPNHNFLGSYEHSGTAFDLYHAVNINGDGVCFARFGNADDKCYYVDDKQTEIGCLTTGAVNSLSANIKAALQEALSRSPKRT